MRYSDNYNLKLPQRGVDRANVDDLDSNFEIIDRALADDRQISLLMYDSTSTYNTGDIVGYENPTTHRIRAFRCLEDNVTGPWDATKWAQTTLADEIGTGGGASSLENLTDTDITSPTNGQTLKYNSTSGKWENASGGAVSDLDDLGDVDITTPSDGDLLTYDAQNDEWVNAPASVPDLGDLGDVTLTTPSDGQALTYDDGDWVNTDLPAVTKTASGNPVEFSDGAAAPLVKCVTAIQGNQDLHGYDKPWVGGAGKNLALIAESTKFNSQACTIDYKNNGVEITATGNYGRSGYSFTVQSGTKYTISFWAYGNAYNQIYFHDANAWTTGYGSLEITSTRTKYTKTITADSNILFVGFYCTAVETSGSMVIEDFMVEAGEQATAFAPYSNICPITAYTEGEMTITGKNIYNATKNTLSNGYYIVYDTGERKSGNQDYKSTSINDNRLLNVSKYIGRTLYSNFTVGGSKPGQAFYDKNFNYISGKKQFPLVVPDGAHYLGITTNADQTDIMISVLPIEEYEPYTSTTHTTTYPTSIYRGSEDVVKGEVVTEWGMIDSYAGETLPGEWISDRDEYAPDTTPTMGAQVAYALATPTTSSVTPTNLPMKSLFGYNHIESSTGDLEVEYITQQQQPIVDLIESSQHVYSAQEQVVGTWVDGSTVYEKTISFTAPSNSYVTVTTDITDFDKCVGYSGIVMLGSGIFEDINYNRPDSNNSSYYTAITADGDIFFRTYEATTGTVYITMRYTKTASTRSLSKATTEAEKTSLEPISEPLETKTDSLSKDEEKAEIEDESKEIEEITEEPEVTEEEPTEEPVDPEPSKEEADER